MHFIGPAAGEQACGDVGPGRMEQPPLSPQLLRHFFTLARWREKKLLLPPGPPESAGPSAIHLQPQLGQNGLRPGTAPIDAGA